MNRLEDKNITIIEALRNIKNDRYVMPAFQRQFVWSMDKIEKLWDSILQGYPISSFLFWHIDQSNVSYDTYFCRFLNDIRFNSSKKSDETNYNLIYADLNITDIAVLDGQQRLTSLFLSLFGEASIRPSNKKRKTSDRILTKLLIELDKNKLNIEDDTGIMQYDIKFSDKISRIEPTKFEIKNILSNEFENPLTRAEEIEKYACKVPSDSRDYARSVLSLLCKKVFDEKLIRYTEIINATSDDALEMFVRFNNGGVALKKSEITMSVLEANWPQAKNMFGSILKDEYSRFDTDFIIRTAHMLFGDVVKSNISKNLVNDLKNNFQNFIIAFANLKKVMKELNIDLTRFQASWNVLIPILFLIYYNPNFMNYIEGIECYLHRAILFTFFQSGTTTKLKRMRDLIIQNDFELTPQILDTMSEFRVNDNKLEDLLELEKGSRLVGEVLYYLSRHNLGNYKYEQDHLHPKYTFDKSQYGVSFADCIVWRKLINKLPNLHLLIGWINLSKNDLSLETFVNGMTDDEKEKFYLQSFIPRDVSFEVKDFGQFYAKRKELLKTKIKEILY